MPKVPVVFIEVALTAGMPKSIHEIIETEGAGARGEPDTAVFYSINNTQHGLAGLGLGKVLVYRVTEALRRDNPDLANFVTLSPIPGFWGRYLRPILEGTATGFLLHRDDVDGLFAGKRRERLLAAAERFAGRRPEDAAAALLEILARPEWIDEPRLCHILEKPLVELAYEYIVRERDPGGRSLNPVANFHLGNGASPPFRTSRV
jgi:Malonyl-CoA decarboxylase (MCD).